MTAHDTARMPIALPANNCTPPKGACKGRYLTTALQ